MRQSSEPGGNYVEKKILWIYTSKLWVVEIAAYNFFPVISLLVLMLPKRWGLSYQFIPDFKVCGFGGICLYPTAPYFQECLQNWRVNALRQGPLFHFPLMW